LKKGSIFLPHLYVCVTAHGFGHLAQLSPIVTELVDRVPGLRVTLQSTVSSDFATECLPAGFMHHQEAMDVGMPMDNPLDTRWPEAVKAYTRFCSRQDEYMQQQRQLLQQDMPDLVLANVPWLPLLAASELGIPAIGLSSLNWLDILREGPQGASLPSSVVDKLALGYQSAKYFIRPTPSMPMTWLENGVDVGPVARLGHAQPEQIKARLGLAKDCKLVIYQLGGIKGGGAQAQIPEIPGVHWLLMNSLPGRKDCSAISDLGLRFIDVLATSDVMLAKPGYGSVVEAACHGVPVLYVARHDWAEEPFLLDWLRQEQSCTEISREAFFTGNFIDELNYLLKLPKPEPVPASGVAQAADIIMDCLG
jgi:hypothetical protein